VVVFCESLLERGGHGCAVWHGMTVWIWCWAKNCESDSGTVVLRRTE